MMPNQNKVPGYFEVRLNSLVPDAALACDVYLVVNEKLTLLRKRGESLTKERADTLRAHGITMLLAPLEQREVYLIHLRASIRDPATETGTKGTLIKESAFVQMQELFTNPNVTGVISGMEALLQEMVGFLSSSTSAAASLLKLSAHDNYTFNHSVNVAVYSIMLVKKLSGVDPNAFVIVGLSALLHDFGKRDIPVAIVKKTTPLSPEEDSLMRQHPTLGEKLLETVNGISPKVKEVVVQHHENFDGSGYPRGLAGNQISQMARIVAVADAFDALTNERPGQKPFTAEQALDLMASLQPGRFDPALFQHFSKRTAQKARIALTKTFDPCSPIPVQVINL